MDKETLSNYGWIVICVLVLAVMIALATPFGDFVADAIKSTSQGLFDTSQNAMDSLGNLTKSPEWLARNHADVIPEGGIYYVNSTCRILSAGDKFPAESMNNDIYTYGDYRYTYVGLYDGWNVVAADKEKDVYAEFLITINKKSIVSMEGAFDGCTNLVASPSIPKTVVIMKDAFRDCTSLTVAPDIHEGVFQLENTFWNCSSISNTPSIPTTAHNMNGTFYGCTSLSGNIKVPCSALIDGNTIPFQCILETFHTDACYYPQ